jgi:methyl-accepting chemotaxis protein
MKNFLMLPAQFLLNSSIKPKQLERDYHLISLYPTNPQNRSANEFEQDGLKSVKVHPIRPYIKHSKVRRKTCFQTIYPDTSLTRGCINCQNGHPNTPKKGFFG